MKRQKGKFAFAESVFTQVEYFADIVFDASFILSAMFPERLPSFVEDYIVTAEKAYLIPLFFLVMPLAFEFLSGLWVKGKC